MFQLLKKAFPSAIALFAASHVPWQVLVGLLTLIWLSVCVPALVVLFRPDGVSSERFVAIIEAYRGRPARSRTAEPAKAKMPAE
ncbi:MAG: hypothetical protein ACTHQ3_09390 [Motilibacteraceae bacterium]